MKQIITILLLALAMTGDLHAQKIFDTRNGKIGFISPTDDDVKAVNNEVSSRISDDGQITFSLLIKGFRFKYAEMQDHFNDQYLESTKFPRADFKGMITNLSDINFSKDGTYKAIVKGDLLMHGVTKNVLVNGVIEIKGGKPSVKASFVIDAANVTDKVTIEINCQYQ